MRSENMWKSLLIVYHISNTPLKIVVAEHDGDGSFETGSSINAIYAHAH